MTLSLALCVQLAIAAAVGAGLVAACRWLQRQSRLCGRLVVAGLLLRAAVMLALFWTSYLNLPILRHLHSADGFWKLAIDAPVYHQSALNAAENGLETVLRGSPSPAFVKGLALWMRVVSSSPVSGGYLNLSLYVLLCLLIVAAFKPTGHSREDLPCAVTLAAVSFSPVLAVYGSQPLKDTMFVVLLGIACLAAFELMPSLVVDGGETRRSRLVELGLAATFLAAIYAISGIRGYYGLLMWSALAWMLFVFAWRQHPARLVRYTAACALLLTAVWFSYMTGADLAYINPYGNSIDAAWAATHHQAPVRRVPGAGPERNGSVLPMVDAYRAGFVLTPGATNIGSRNMGADPTDLNGPSPITRGTAAPLPGSGLRDRLSAVTLGLGLIFVPVSLLRALSIVDFTGGRGLLAITDVDTLVMDLTIVAAIALLVRRRSAVRDRLPYVCFTGTLGIVAALLMAYIVTNFGTLFRLRLMVAVPLWMLPLALATPASRRDGTGDEDRHARVEPSVAQDSGSATHGMGTRPELLDLLVCPTCAGQFRTEDDGVDVNVLRCARCGLVVPIREGIPRFIEDLRDRPADPVARLAARTQASFGYEWTHFHRWHDSGEINFLDYFETADLSGAREGRVLDAGCGMGRHARQLAAHVRHVIAIDFSRAIEQAAINTRGVSNVDCVQADLLRLPFLDESFDYIYSFGVLHHLANTEIAVRALVAKLKPGGRLRVYLYWKRHGWEGAVLRLVNGVRPVTTRLPFWLLRWFCWALSVVLWLALILPYRLLASAGVRGMSQWPLFVYAKYPFWILYNDQFDRFSAPLEKRYDPEEVSALLESAGLQDVRVEARFGWIAEGVKGIGQAGR